MSPLAGFLPDTSVLVAAFCTWHEHHEPAAGALKAMARTPWAEGQPRTFSKTWYQPVADPEEAALALRFTLSQPITAAIPPGEAALFRLAVDVAAQFRPLTPEETAELRRRASALQPIFRLAA